MPHLIVKLYSGRSEQQKAVIAEAITKAVMEHGNGEGSISVGFGDVTPSDWTENVRTSRPSQIHYTRSPDDPF